MLCYVVLCVQVEQQGDPMTITITGPKNTAEPCRQEIMALINDPYPPGPGEMVLAPGARSCLVFFSRPAPSLTTPPPPLVRSRKITERRSMGSV